MYGVQSVHDR